jgi:hypothetical protein
LAFRRGKQGRSVGRVEHRLWRRGGVGEWFGIDGLSYGQEILFLVSMGYYVLLTVTMGRQPGNSCCRDAEDAERRHEFHEFATNWEKAKR